MSSKQKNQQKTKGSDKSPSNNRNIPVKQKSRGLAILKNEWKVILASFISGVVVMVICFVLFNNYLLYSELLLEKEKREEIVGNVRKWEKIVTKYPDYRDGHYNLALLYYQIHETDKSLYHLNKSLQLDPNFIKGRELKSSITGEK